MIFYGCTFCKHLNRDTFNDCSAFPDRIPISIISGEQIHDSEWDQQEGDEVFELAPTATEIPILLQSIPTEAIVWDQEDFESLGALNGQAVIQVGVLPADKLVCVVTPQAVDDTLFASEEDDEEDFDDFEEEPIPDSITADAVPLSTLKGVFFYQQSDEPT